QCQRQRRSPRSVRSPGRNCAAGGDARQYRRGRQRKSRCADPENSRRQRPAGKVNASGESAPQAPLKGLSLAVTAFALAMGTFMQVLDTTIANVSLPTIAGNLGASTDQSTWIITSFVVANGIGVPITGWLMSRYGIVKVFVLSILGFTLASFL